MDLIIPDSWLRKLLKTEATPSEMTKYMSLCGPSFERSKLFKDRDTIYSVEITTNRVDSASILGIAREASAILPRFGFKTLLLKRPSKIPRIIPKKTIPYLSVKVDTELCTRFTAILIKNVNLKDSPADIKLLLEKVGLRPINNIVDISNYVMHELGQPVHTFDYDKIKDKKMTLREAKNGESIITLDGKSFNLKAGDIIIEDGKSRIIDLCGIMGGELSAVDANTKNVLLFIQNYNKDHIRKTSMRLGQRTEAAVLFEKGLDSEQVEVALFRCLELFILMTGGQPETQYLDIYPKPYQSKFLKISKNKLDKIIGLNINKSEISKYLKALGFEIVWKEQTLTVKVPSYRASDIDIPEDIAEEIARIYGYHNLPSQLMTGQLPQNKKNSIFDFETKLRYLLASLKGIEVYNLPLVGKNMILANALRLRNSMGSDTEYLRDNLHFSLIQNILDNLQEKSIVHLFEIANIYKAKTGKLPDEIMTLAGIIKNSDFRSNKGLIETFLEEIEKDYIFKIEDNSLFKPGQCLAVYSNNQKVGEFGNMETTGYPELDNSLDLFFYNFDVYKLAKADRLNIRYKDIPKYPPQIEDITFVLPERTLLGNVSDEAKKISPDIVRFDLKGVYENSYTFNVWYQNETHTLDNKEVEELRNKVIKTIEDKFGAVIKA